MPEHVRGFYAFHSCLMEPWDGPAAIAFTDGRLIGATLDRNGLRPGRWLETKDGWVVMGSETGVMDEAPENIARRGPPAAGQALPRRHRAGPDRRRRRESSDQVARGGRTGAGTRRASSTSPTCPSASRALRAEPLRARQLAFGYSQEDLRCCWRRPRRRPRSRSGRWATTSRSPCCRTSPRRCSPTSSSSSRRSPTRRSTRSARTIVMSVATGVGPERNLLDESPEHAHQLAIEQPILRKRELEKLRQVDSSVFRPTRSTSRGRSTEGPDGLERALERICAEAEEVLEDGVNILILSDRASAPSARRCRRCCAVAAVHHHLVRAGTRLQAGLVLESGEPREVHHFATLIGYGAAAINPYVMFESLAELHASGRLPDT
jgi:hypothetical protein